MNVHTVVAEETKISLESCSQFLGKLAEKYALKCNLKVKDINNSKNLN